MGRAVCLGWFLERWGQAVWCGGIRFGGFQGSCQDQSLDGMHASRLKKSSDTPNKHRRSPAGPRFEVEVLLHPMLSTTSLFWTRTLTTDSEQSPLFEWCMLSSWVRITRENQKHQKPNPDPIKPIKTNRNQPGPNRLVHS